MLVLRLFLSAIWYGGTSFAAVVPRASYFSPNGLPACAFGSPEPCRCPENTTFQNSTTTVTIGANAKDIAAILYSFFDVPWIGVDPVETSGEDLTVGSTRTMPLDGLYLVEELLEAWKTQNGSYKIVLGQKNVPIVLNETYYFSGYWDDSETTYLNDTHTELLWHAHGCITLPAGFDTFQRDAISNTFKYLKDRDQLVGNSTLPLTVVFPPEMAGSTTL